MLVLKPLSGRLALILLSTIVFVAAWLRFTRLGSQSLWFDEAATWGQISGSFADIFPRTAEDNYPPLFNILSWTSIQVFGDAEWAMRLPSALLGVGNVLLIYGFATRLGGRAAGLFAALLLALSGFHVWYSQEARGYALLAFAATAHGWAVFELTQRRNWQATLLAGLSGVALTYTHPYGVLTWIAVGAGGLWLLVARRDWRTTGLLLAAGVGAGLCFLPWALILLGRAEAISAEGFWVPYPTWTVIWLMLRSLTGTWLVIFIPLAFLPLWPRAFRPSGWAHPTPLLVSWTFGPLAMGLAASMLIEPVLISYYLIGSLPPAIVLASLGLATITRTRRSFAIAFASIATLSVVSYLSTAPSPRDNWRTAVAQLERIDPANTCVAVSVDWLWLPVDYYWRQPLPCRLTFDPAIEVPAGRSVIVFVTPQERRGFAAEVTEALAPTMTPTGRQRFRGITVLSFDPKP